jgi:hypothetical protein
MTAGLFYVYTDPGTLDEAEFHDWYDHEHGPARLTVPGFGRAYRYGALDGDKPPWLALYERVQPRRCGGNGGCSACATRSGTRVASFSDPYDGDSDMTG